MNSSSLFRIGQFVFRDLLSIHIVFKTAFVKALCLSSNPVDVNLLFVLPVDSNQGKTKPTYTSRIVCLEFRLIG